MKSRIFLMLFTASILVVTSASAQMDSAAIAKKQKEIEKSEKSISKAQGKVDKKERKMERAQKRADRKQRKREKKLNKLQKAEKKHEQLIRDTTVHSYLLPVTSNPIALFKVPAPVARVKRQPAPDPADRLTNNVRV